MGIARLLPLCLLALLVQSAEAKEGASLIRTLAEAEVDWQGGILTAQAGAAADIRMPGPSAARPGAERRARAAAQEKLGSALRTLTQAKPLEDKLLDAALEHAIVARTEYQSNGGVILWLALRFADVSPARDTVAAPLSLTISSMPLTLAPLITAGGAEVRVAYATYSPKSARSAPAGTIAAKLDAKGRLLLPAAESKRLDSFAGAAVVIYLEKAPS